MIVPNCHPSVTGKTPAETDKMVSSTLASKIAEVKSWCATCPITRDCLAQGFWTNEDNKRVVLEGIFGGLTQAERKGLLK